MGGGGGGGGPGFKTRELRRRQALARQEMSRQASTERMSRGGPTILSPTETVGAPLIVGGN